MKAKFLSLAVAASTLLATSTLAADIPKEGPFDFVACWSGDSREIAFSPRHTASSYEFTGTIRSNPPSGPFDKETFRCVGSGTTFEGKTTGSNTCEGTDGAGNKRVTYFTTNPDGSVTRDGGTVGSRQMSTAPRSGKRSPSSTMSAWRSRC